MARGSTVKQIANVRIQNKHYTNHKMEIYQNFMVVKKAFDMVWRHALANNEDVRHRGKKVYVVKGALYRIYKVRIQCRRLTAKFSAIVSPALVMHDRVHRRDLRGSC